MVRGHAARWPPSGCDRSTEGSLRGFGQRSRSKRSLGGDAMVVVLKGGGVFGEAAATSEPVLGDLVDRAGFAESVRWFAEGALADEFATDRNLEVFAEIAKRAAPWAVGERAGQRRDRRAAVHLRANRREPRVGDPRQPGCGRPGRGGGRGIECGQYRMSIRRLDCWRRWWPAPARGSDQARAPMPPSAVVTLAVTPVWPFRTPSASTRSLCLTRPSPCARGSGAASPAITAAHARPNSQSSGSVKPSSCYTHTRSVWV